eukprot:CAMPEP_0181302920 /NCGR_PEP_ID=MMETSP1101-20121128/8261_1 /TAXON_ID=46948 /ORGANISM="Rhodomonas abbreviata, Strain Caron Lab Isolate" /LENGTH=93 /DNA_ID=CAMNT_0023408417 /DNA_START=244 /DNA_END=525 /DNA_ORIENTATION=+
MFSDITHLQSLFSSSWPATTLGDDATNDGNTGSVWNYGSNFGGPLKDTWLTGADTIHSGGVGMFGTMGVGDDAYNGVNQSVPLCTDAGCTTSS